MLDDDRRWGCLFANDNKDYVYDNDDVNDDDKNDDDAVCYLLFQVYRMNKLLYHHFSEEFFTVFLFSFCMWWWQTII